MPAHIAGVLHAVPAPVWLPHPSDVNELLPSLWSANTSKDNGVLHLAGHSVPELAANYGTPCYLFDVADFRARAQRFRAAFTTAFADVGTSAEVFYAGKAFLATAVAGWVAEEGLGLDTCSLGEMMIAHAAGFPAQRIALHGNNKSQAELEYALDIGVGRIVVDSLDEVARLGDIAKSREVVVPVFLRITVGVEAHTHDFIATAHEDQKFGLSLQSGAAREAAAAIIADPGLQLAGIHSHIGSQIFDMAGFDVAAGRVINFRAELERDFGITIHEVDLGGGFGIQYTSQDTPQSPEDMARSMAQTIVKSCAESGSTLPRVSVEPGRAIVGPAVMTVYQVGTVKWVDTGAGTRCYVSVDGGMSDNIRTALYDADYSCTMANRASTADPAVVRVVGKHCESGDIIVRDEYLAADVSAGDLIAVPGTGAYCRPLANNYNYLPKPGVLAVEESGCHWIITPENYETMFYTDPGFISAGKPVGRKEEK